MPANEQRPAEQLLVGHRPAPGQVYEDSTHRLLNGVRDHIVGVARQSSLNAGANTRVQRADDALGGPRVALSCPSVILDERREVSWSPRFL